jgi:hypothetical protein
MVSAISLSQAQFTAAKPSEARMAGAIREGAQGGSNVIMTSTEPTPGTRAAAFATLFKETDGGASRGGRGHGDANGAINDRDVVDEAEVNDVVTQLGIDHDAQSVPKPVDEFSGHDGALTVSS